MQEFVITLLFGWLGVHRFIKKRYATGVLWLCTFGLCGCGWIYDTVKAYKHMKENKNISSGLVLPTRQFVKSFDTVIVGTFAPCDKDKGEKREDLIRYVKPNWKLDLEYWEYNKQPAYYVLHPNGLDLGNVRQGLAKILYEEYRDCEFEVKAISKAYDENNDCQTYNIRIDIYK